MKLVNYDWNDGRTKDRLVSHIYRLSVKRSFYSREDHGLRMELLLKFETNRSVSKRNLIHLKV